LVLLLLVVVLRGAAARVGAGAATCGGWGTAGTSCGTSDTRSLLLLLLLVW
jgi:hypothetical protein